MGGAPLTGLPPHKVVEQGVALVPEGRGIFGDLTVRDNLLLGANPTRAREDAGANFERLVKLFPKLSERAGQSARTMSGGEQQMVAIGRAMMSNPIILMLDEPSLGLSPLLSKELFHNLKAVRAAGLGILLVEQNARLSLGIADRGYLLENGTILREDRAELLRNDPAVQAAYLGGGAARPGAAKAVAPVPIRDVSTPPALVRVVARPISTRPAAQVAGLDIDALVLRAGQQSRNAPPKVAAPTSVKSASLPAPRSDALRQMLHHMETAAHGARAQNRPSIAPLPPLRPSVIMRLAVAQPAAQNDPTPAAQPAPIHTQGTGKVDIYRRRPGSSHFDKMES
jgi:branched-chain amino acid transport system ATP-binding protein